MRKRIGILLLGLLLVGSSLQAIVKELPPEKWREELAAIDDAIEELKDLRNKELSRAARKQNDGDRLQFQTDSLLDAKRAWAEAEASREIAARYQEEIDKLEIRKIQILNTHQAAAPS